MTIHAQHDKKLSYTFEEIINLLNNHFDSEEIKNLTKEQLDLTSETGESLLIHYVQKGKSKIVYYLMHKNVDLEYISPTKKSALIYAIKTAPLMAQFLLKYGAKLNQTDPNNDPLILATQDNPQLIPLLLFHGADVNIQDETGYTALMSLIIDKWSIPGTEHYTQLILEKEPNLLLKNKRGHTALDLAQNMLTRFSNDPVSRKTYELIKSSTQKYILEQEQSNIRKQINIEQTKQKIKIL